MRCRREVDRHVKDSVLQLVWEAFDELVLEGVHLLSCLVVIHDHVAGNHVCARMLIIRIFIEAPQFLPFYNGKHGAQRVELCDLNIRRVQIFVAVAQE